mgnify:FL=1
MDDQRKAYVGKSRTREADHSLFVQPYSPHLFRQGELPGPNILMDYLRRKITTVEAQKAWKKVDKAKREKSILKSEKKWLDIMPLPCRNCSNDEDQATWKPLSAFNMQFRKQNDLWKYVVAKGQDLLCIRCTNHVFLSRNPFRRSDTVDRNKFLQQNPNIRCDKCDKWDSYTRFDEDMVDQWLHTNGDITCKKCVRGHHMEKYSDMETFDCYACQQKWTSNCFLHDDLLEHRVHQTPLTLSLIHI